MKVHLYTRDDKIISTTLRDEMFEINPEGPPAPNFSTWQLIKDENLWDLIDACEIVLITDENDLEIFEP